jgi:hypothetical protein
MECHNYKVGTSCGFFKHFIPNEKLSKQHHFRIEVKPKGKSGLGVGLGRYSIQWKPIASSNKHFLIK